MRRSAVLAAAIAIGACASATNAELPNQGSTVPPETLTTATVTFHPATGDVPVAVEVARSFADRQQGLMFREQLAADSGMLFIFDQEAVQTFWMKNTYISLDMIFLDTQRKVVGIVRAATPQSTESLSVGVPSRYVVEVIAGYAASHNIDSGVYATFTGVDP